MANLKKVSIARRQENLPTGVDKNIYVRAYEFDAVVDRVNSIASADATLVGDTISESTAAAGVTVDGVLLKDGAVSSSAPSVYTGTAGVANLRAN